VWFDHRSFDLKPGQRLVHVFPVDVRGKWIRFRAESAGTLSTMFIYE
jgi:hypothetical protein